jgi:putative ABC transport system permease protein
VTGRFIHWRYAAGEMAYRWRRTALFVGGIALALALVVMLDILGRAFADLATVPFRNLGADLIVQRTATQAALPKQMGIILPYSAQPITGDELQRLSAQPGVAQAAGFVLLWNLGAGRFFSVSGIPMDQRAPAIGPGRARDWLLQGRLPRPGTQEVLVERHYGAFFRLNPGSSVVIGAQSFEVVGVVDIKEGSQIVASNFYLDIGEARALASLPPDLINQVFLKLADMGETESVKRGIAAWLPQASVTSPGTMLQLFGSVSQTIGQFRWVAVVAGAAASLALCASLVFGNLIERRREIAIVRTIGWTRAQVRRQIAVEMAVQGLLGGMLALVLVAIGVDLLAQVTVSLPLSLPGENPADFAAGGFHAASQNARLPVSTTLADWLVPVVAAGLVSAVCGWWWAAHLNVTTLWAAVKSG